ncbi:MAG TPA: cell division protein FtsA [Candidatus Acidoferrales bacterium]|jgi:cell division protein FtsA|nr:cell division protein FtsA [Candidatus Acidoferrales bacterium]
MKHGTVCGLDIGTTKTCTVVATNGPSGLEIVGFGEAPSLGMRKGVVVDLDETIKSIESATERAERMAGVHFSEVFVGITGDHIRSTNNRAVVAVSGEDREVTSGDVRRVIDASKIINLPTDRQIIHALPRYFTVDGQEGVNDPIGMAGGRLEVDTHIVTGSTSFITNVLKCVQRAGLDTVGVVFEPLASSAATLLQEERQVGVVLLDIGGGTTDIAVYSLGSAIYTATIPVGGNVLTSDISLGLKTTLSEAEEVKKRLGAAQEERTFAVRTLDGRATKEHSTAELRQIVIPRVLETLRMAKQKIVENVPRDLVLGEVVLTGGGAQLPGIGPIAEDVFGLPVRTGTPNALGGLTEVMAAPQYATAVGLVLFGANGDRDDASRVRRRGSGMAARVQRWLADLWT